MRLAGSITLFSMSAESSPKVAHGFSRENKVATMQFGGLKA
jgi:hypothetical protein